MAKRYTVDFSRNPVRIAISDVLKWAQVSSDLGGRLFTLNTWVQEDQYDDLILGPHADVEKGSERRRHSLLAAKSLLAPGRKAA